MRRGWMWWAVALMVAGLVLAWRASEGGVEQTSAPATVGVAECGSLIRPVEEPSSACRSRLDDQMVGALGLFYLAEALLLAAAWSVVVATKPARLRRRSDLFVGVAALVVSPLFLLPGQAVGFSAGWGASTTAAQLLLFLGALPVPLMIGVWWNRRSVEGTTVSRDPAVGQPDLSPRGMR